MAAHEPLNLLTFLKENASDDMKSEQIDEQVKSLIAYLTLSTPNKQYTLSSHPNFSTQYKQRRKSQTNIILTA